MTRLYTYEIVEGETDDERLKFCLTSIDGGTLREGQANKRWPAVGRASCSPVRYYDEMHAAITAKYRCPLYQLKERTSVSMERLDKNDGVLDSY